jgi:hypothetical protein
VDVHSPADRRPRQRRLGLRAATSPIGPQPRLTNHHLDPDPALRRGSVSVKPPSETPRPPRTDGPSPGASGRSFRGDAGLAAVGATWPLGWRRSPSPRPPTTPWTPASLTTETRRHNWGMAGEAGAARRAGNGRARLLCVSCARQRLEKSAHASDQGFCSPDWTRTNNPAINSRMLCQLSYGGSAGATRWPVESTSPARRGRAGTRPGGGAPGHR